MRDFKEDFKKWLYNYRSTTLEVLQAYDDSMQFGVYQDFLLDAFDRYIEIYANASGWGFMITKGGYNGTVVWEIKDFMYFETLKEAREQALIKAIELYEKL
jgi:hypothetical protein